MPSNRAGGTTGGTKYAPFFTREPTIERSRQRAFSSMGPETRGALRKMMAGQARQAMNDARRLTKAGQDGLARSARSSARDLANAAPPKGNQPRHPKGSPSGGQWR